MLAMVHPWALRVRKACQELTAHQDRQVSRVCKVKQAQTARWLD